MNDELNAQTSWKDYMESIRPDLSSNSIKIYFKILEKISLLNKVNDINPHKLAKKLINKSMRDSKLTFITEHFKSLSAANQAISTVRNLINAEAIDLDPKKVARIQTNLSLVGDDIRAAISENAGNNIKSESEEKNMKVSWNELEEFAKDYHVGMGNMIHFRNKVMLNLIFNNSIEKDGIKYNVILRPLEYATLRLWTNAKPPPADGENYIWVKQSAIIIQNSKTVGGVKKIANVIVNQKKMKRFPLNADLLELISTYSKTLKIKNKQRLFYIDSMSSPLSPSYFGSKVKQLLTKFGDNISMNVVRKIYESRVKPEMNGNQLLYEQSLNDHSLSTSAIFYKKI